MAQKPQLILGTANFGLKAYGTLTEPLPLTTVGFILNKARQGGIKILEGSEQYGCDEVLRDKSFELLYKVRHPYNLNGILERTARTSLMALMYHHGYTSPSDDLLYRESFPKVRYIGASIYHFEQLQGDEQIVEVPLNIENTEFEKTEYPCKIVRSVFGRGELLKKYSLQECLDFVKNNETVHGVIVGVDNIKQLDEVLEAWNK